MSVDESSSDEIAAALAARRELGPDYDSAIAASLAEKFERRLEAELAARASDPARDLRIAQSVTTRWVGVGSLAAGTAATVALSASGGDGVERAWSTAFVWVGIAAVNIAAAVGRRRRD